MAGAEEEEEKEEDLAEDVSGIMGSQVLLSLLTVMGFSITIYNCVLAWDLPPITSNCSDMGCFQPVSSTPRLLSHLMCLTIFTWMPWNARPLV